MVNAELMRGLPPRLDRTAFDRLLSEVAARRKEFERQKQISPDIIDRFRTLGIYRALVARRFGGWECSPPEFCHLIEAISAADGSAGWVASFGVGAILLSALPVSTLSALYSDTPDIVIAGGIFPARPATHVSGGFAINGRWCFASGCMSADLICVSFTASNDKMPCLPRMAVLASNKARILPNWDVVGLIGTGSHDVAVDNIVVPEHWTFVRGGGSSLDGALYEYPSLSFAAEVLAAVALGIARAALDEVIAIANGHSSVRASAKSGDRPYTQIELAKAEADLRSARSWFYEAIDDVWRTLLGGDAPTREQISLLRLSSTHGTQIAADAARRVQMLTGMTGVCESSPLAAQVRDAQMITQHAFLGETTYQNAGAIFFGSASSPGYL
jgi:alkylation response protein AidB-like acyl-CoA dehydrogenase